MYRYVVDKDEFLHWLNMIPPWSCELNIPGRRMKVREIVREYVNPVKQLRVLSQEEWREWAQLHGH